MAKAEDCRFYQAHGSGGVCRKMTAFMGWPIIYDRRLCKACMARGDSEREVAESAHFLSDVKRGLFARIHGGDCPRYMKPDHPFDLSEVFTRFAAMSTRTEQYGLLKRAFRRWLSISEARGGHPTATVVRKFIALAQAHGMEDVLNEIRVEHRGAAA